MSKKRVSTDVKASAIVEIVGASTKTNLILETNQCVKNVLEGLEPIHLRKIYSCNSVIQSLSTLKMTKKRSKTRGRVGKQKGRSELVAHELGKKEKAKNLSKSGKKAAGLPFNENGRLGPKKADHQAAGEEKLKRREAFELQRQQAREKALEDKRIRVRAQTFCR